ncbi:hypothetical protein CLIB1423_03S02102 [[Candida] railenensis]|uniref:Cell wall protein n=1 Tax=[Candida] railenensis TaxID=45579 RepID=A0A9P0QM62_9ASCO|nr:hypothetical protein CLIB1423_03S02102 [[Candida] railenensis]
MQFLTTSAILALAVAVAADQTFTLTASGDGVSGPVTFNGQYLGLNNGAAAATLTLQEPSGYLTDGGSSYFHLASPAPYYIAPGTEGEASKDWGFNGSAFRFGPSIDSEDFYACQADSGYYISAIRCDGGIQVSLTNGGAAPAESSSSSAPVSSSAPAPASSAASTSVPASDTSAISSAPVSHTSSATAVTTSAASSNGTETVTNHSFTTSTVCDSCTQTHATVTSIAGGNKLTVGVAGIAAVAALMI